MCLYLRSVPFGAWIYFKLVIHVENDFEQNYGSQYIYCRDGQHGDYKLHVVIAFVMSTRRTISFELNGITRGGAIFDESTNPRSVKSLALGIDIMRKRSATVGR